VSDAKIVAVGADTGAVEPTVAPPVERPRAQAPARKGGLLENLVPVAVASALFMEFLDSTALSTALPTLARAFHTDPVHLKLALTSYLLALAVFAPASGWVAERFGAKKVFLAAMGVFLVGSALCGLSRSLPVLIAFRMLQGLGGAMMTPVGRLIVVRSAPRDRFVNAMSWFTMPALVGPLLGPPISGLILGVADWPWIFYVNVPVGIIGMAAVAALVPDLRQPEPGRFDTRGFMLAALGIVGLTAVAETAGTGLIPLSLEVASAVLGAGALVLFVRHALRAERPVLDLRLLSVPTFRASMAGGTLLRLGLGASPLLLPLLLQIGFGWSPVKAGVVTIAQSLGALALKPVAAPVLRRFGYRRVLVAAALATAVATAMPALFRLHTPEPAIFLVLLASGFVRSCHFTAANALAYAGVPKAEVAQASTLSTVIQQVGMSLGVSVGGLALHLARGGSGALTADHFTAPFLVIGAISLLAAPVYARLPRDAGAEIGGRQS
jgi:EmrB/QacA subfamily drug resistance transporter